jgi:hypothetical protein
MNYRALLPLAAAALIGANEPLEVVEAGRDASSERFREFGGAVMACIDATQINASSMAAIEKRGWAEYPQKDPEIAKLLATFARSGSPVLVTYAASQQGCSAVWSVSSSQDSEALLAVTLESVTDQLSSEYPESARTETVDPVTRRILAGESIGLLRVEAVNEAPVKTIRFQSTTRDALEARLSLPQQSPTQTPQGQ